MNKCQLPVLDKKTGQVLPCHNGDIKIFNYEGSNFYFCSEHYNLVSENIESLNQALEKEAEDYLKNLSDS
jgi:hypothetical protein